MAFALGGVAALLGALGLFIYATFDANRLKSEVVQIVKEKKQRTLAIDGNVALSFWPPLGLRLGRTRLSEHASDGEFAALDSARVSLALLPLLSRQVVIDQLELAGVSAALVRDKDGKLNIDDLLSRDEPPENQSLRFDIASIKLADSRLELRDEQSGRSATLSALNLTTGRIANVAHGRLQLVGKLASEKPAIATDLLLASDYDMDLDHKRFALTAVDLRIKGDAAALSKVDLTLSAGRLGVDPAATQVDAEKLRLIARAMLDDDSLDVRLDAPTLQASPDKTSGEALNLTARYAGAQRAVDAKLDLAGMQGSAKVLQVARLALSFDAKAGDVVAKGSVDSPLTANLQTLAVEMPAFALDFDARAGANTVKGRLATPLKANLQAMTVELAKLAGELTVANPQMPMKSVRLPLDGQARADLNKQSASGQLSSSFDESMLRSKFTVSRFSPLTLGFELDVDRLNADKYFPPAAPNAKKAPADKPVDLSALKGINANGVVRIGALQASGIKVSNLKLEIKAVNGKLDVAPHSASLYDGTLAGSFSADANGNRFVARETLTNVNIHPLLRDVTGTDMLEGRGNLSFDIATGGASVSAIKRGLGGTARLSLRDGAVKGINLAKILRDYKALARTGATKRAAAGEKTDFTELSAAFRIAGGVAHNDDLQARSPLLWLTGSGDIHLADDRINYLARATVVNTATGQEGKDLANLKGISVPVRLAGPFEALTFQPDFAAVASDLARARLGQTPQQLQQAAKNKVSAQVPDKPKGAPVR
jgi:AsmA protein